MHRLIQKTELSISLHEAWDFFSKPSNLKKLTPEFVNFQMAPDFAEQELYAGQILSYTIRPLLNIPIHWVTEITQVEKPYYFVDEQRFGPYKFWHHEHRFREIEKGVEIKDLIYYKLPLGPIGELFHSLKVKKDIEAIFNFRNEKLKSLF